MVGAVHRQHDRPRLERCQVRDDATCPREQLFDGFRQRGSVPVRRDEVRRAHARTVRGFPMELRTIDRAWNAAPHRGFGEPTEPQYLWHLCDVPERVGDVAEALRPAQRVRPRRALLQVAHDRLGRAQELVHEDAPRPDAEPPVLHLARDVLFGAGADLEVVLDRGDLTVEVEVTEPGVGVQNVEQLVHRVHELQPVALERLVPLSVPVRMRDDVDDGLRGHAASISAAPRAFDVAVRAPATDNA